VVPELEGMSVTARKRWKAVGGKVGRFWGTIQRALGGMFIVLKTINSSSKLEPLFIVLTLIRCGSSF
jgi:hypothetical protein